jgi:tRNA threonylcarbamoyladenosine biosynthesis protein TsaB
MNNLLPILAIESSADLCSAAVFFNENNTFEENLTGKHVHSEKLLTTINGVLEKSTLTINDIKTIAISIGPGSFTGLRIGMATAKGLAFGVNLPIIPVPTYNAFALQVFNEIENGENFIIANSVNTEELYVSEFKREDNHFKTITNVHLVKKREFRDEIYSNCRIFGNFIDAKSEKKISSPNAVFVAKWAYLFGKDLLTSNYDYLEPNYIKNFIAKVKK